MEDQKSHDLLNKCKHWINASPAYSLGFNYKTLDEKDNSVISEFDGTIILAGNLFKTSIMGQEIYCDGETIWSYTPSTKEVNINEFVERDMSKINPFSQIQNFDTLFRTKYIRSQIIDNKKCDLIDLIPSTENTMHKIRVCLLGTNSQPLSIEIYNNDGNVYLFTIKSTKAIKKIDKKEFSFDPKNYPGIKINDMR